MCRLRTVERRRWSGDLEVGWRRVATRSEEHTSELQSQSNLVCRLLLEKKKTIVKGAIASSALIPAIQFSDGGRLRYYRHVYSAVVLTPLMLQRIPVLILINILLTHFL